MRFTFTAAFLALLAAPATLASPASKRQTGAVTCAFVFVSETPVPSTTNFVAEFNFVIGNALAQATGSLIFNEGSTFVENPDNTFNVEDTVVADGKTAVETAAILTGLAGTTEASFDGITWLFQSVDCN